MSTDTKHKLNTGEQDYDDKFNPVFDPEDVDRKFKQITSTPDMQALNDQGDAAARDYSPDNTDGARRALTGQENDADQNRKTAIGDTRTGQAAIDAAKIVGTPLAGRIAATLGKIRVNQSSGGAVAGIGVVIAILMGASFLTASLGPIAFFTHILDDLNDQLPSLDKRLNKLTRAKFTKGERKTLLKGCTKMSIRCKMKSLSKRDIKRLNSAGITVEGDTKVGRTFPDKYVITENGQTKSYNPAELADLIASKEPSIAKARLRVAYNMRSVGFMDKKFAYVLRKIGLTKAAAKLTGNVEEDLDKITKGEAGITTDNKVVMGKDKDGKPTVNGNSASAAEAEATQAIAEGAANGFKDGLKQFTKVISLTGMVDMLCTLKNMIGYSATVAKFAKGIKLAAYVMEIAPLVYKIKAGDGTPHDAEVIGKLFNSPDTRKTITDVNATMATYNKDTKQMTEKKMDNPYYGKTVMDGSLYKMSSINAPTITTEATQHYSLGISIKSLLGVLTFAALVMRALALKDTLCKVVQNWAARGLAFVVGILSWFTGAGEAITLGQIGIAAAVSAAMIAVGIGLAVVTNQNPVPDDIAQKPEEIHAALWSGNAYMAGETAKARGLIPGTDEEILAYSRDLKATNLAYSELETENVAWNDMSSPYSKLSRVATAFESVSQPSSQTGSSYLMALLSTATHAISSPLYTTASAATIDPSRLKKCEANQFGEIDMQAHAALNGGPIAMDVQCNVRYFMPPEDLSLDTDAVAKYMEDNNYVEKDPETGMSMTGLPEGYTLPSDDTQKNIVVSFLEGTAKGWVDQFYSTRNYGSEYGKFLDFCAYRAIPWGETFEESSGIGAAEADWVNGKNCQKRGAPYSYFRIYTLDNSLAEINEPPDATGDSTDGGTVSGDVKSLAQQILDLETAGKITLSVAVTGSDLAQDEKDHVTPKLMLQDLAAGKPVGRTTRSCGRFTPPYPINPDPKILQFMVDLGGSYHYTATSLFGGCHSSVSSNHYQGKAVDFGNCPFDTAIANSVGKKYGVSHNGESCAVENHYHYSVGGG